MSDRKIIYVDRARGLTDSEGEPLRMGQLDSLARLVLHAQERLRSDEALDKLLDQQLPDSAGDVP